MPGFRRILPRASYVLLSKGYSSNQVSVDSPVDGGPPSTSLTQEPHLTPLGLVDAAELPEQPSVVGDITEETTVTSHPTDRQGIQNISSSVSSKAPASMNSSVATLERNETSIAGCGFSGDTVQQNQVEPTQMVAIIPTQVMTRKGRNSDLIHKENF